MDIAYLNYLPFCMIFVSGDDLHRRCAPQYFMALPEAEKERGIMACAHAPPKVEGSLVRRLRAKYLRPGIDDEPPANPPAKDGPKSEELVRELSEWTKAPTAPEGFPSAEVYDPQVMAIQRQVRRKKGSWWQVSKDLPDDPDDRE